MTKEFWKNWFESQEEWFYNNFRRKYAIREALEKIDNPVDDLGLANGCSKLCIIDHKAGFVLKWSTDLNYNEMAKEYKYYQKAVECGIECFFPKTEILTEVNGITIFVQEKVDTLLHDMNYRKRETLRNKHQKTVKEEFVRKVRNDFYSSPAFDWVVVAISVYGKNRVKELCKFTREHKINDLHDANVGFNGNYPVILDFSGYHQDSDSDSDCNSSW